MNKYFLSQETRHLLYWWYQWLKYLLNTTYHLFNRKAYHQWKKKRNTSSEAKYQQWLDSINAGMEECFESEIEF